MKQPYDITRVSPLDNKARTKTIIFDMEDYKDWEMRRELIQDAFPYLTPNEREFLMTGITQDQWDELFKEE